MRRQSATPLLLLILVLALVAGTVAGCGDKDPYTGSWGNGMIKINKAGDTYSIQDKLGYSAKSYTGTVRNGALVADIKPIGYTFTLDGDWLVQKSAVGSVIRFEKD